MDQTDSQTLDELAELVASIDQHIGVAIDSLSTLFYSPMSKTDADRIRTAVFAIQSGNNILREVIGMDDNAEATPDVEPPVEIETSRTKQGAAKSQPKSVQKSTPAPPAAPAPKPGQKPQRAPMPKPMPGMEWISASRNLQRLVYDVGPQRPADVISAGLATSPDEAMALMNELVESNNATWIKITGTQAIMAVR